jgi:hypothetical protein
MNLRLIIPAIFPWVSEHEAGATLYLEPCTRADEGICGVDTCSAPGLWHIAWDFKLLKPSYPFPGIHWHFLGMFVASALLGQWIAAIVLFCSGPGISFLFEGVGAGERASERRFGASFLSRKQS